MLSITHHAFQLRYPLCSSRCAASGNHPAQPRHACAYGAPSAPGAHLLGYHPLQPRQLPHLRALPRHDQLDCPQAQPNALPAYASGDRSD